MCRSISIDTLTTPGGLKHAANDSFAPPRGEYCDLCHCFAMEESLWSRQNFRLVLRPERPRSAHRALGFAHDDGEADIAYPIFTNEGMFLCHYPEPSPRCLGSQII